MADINLLEFSREDLVKLRKDVDKAIASYDERRKQEALVAVETKAKELGFSLAELTNAAKKPRRANPPKYRHPENPATTWSGRGRQPAWIKEGLASGKSLDDYLIE